MQRFGLAYLRHRFVLCQTSARLSIHTGLLPLSNGDAGALCGEVFSNTSFDY